MKKVLSFCVLSVLFVVLTLGLKAQSGLVLTPANMPDPIVLNQYDTVIISPNSSCFDALHLSDTDRVSIEWKVLYNGHVIPNDSLSYYFEDFKFESRYDLGNAERWWGDSYTSHYCQNGNGYGSYPGAHTPTQGLELGQPCEDDGHFSIVLPGQNNPYEFDYFYVRWFKDVANTAHRLVYNIKVDGEYQFIFSLAKRCGGTKWDMIYEDNDERYYVGGHQSVVCGILSSDTLRAFIRDTIGDQFTCIAQLPFVLGGVEFWTPTPAGMLDSVVFHGVSSCHISIDSIVYFRLIVQDPQVPTLDTVHSNLLVCDSGMVHFEVLPEGADKVIWYNDANVAVDTNWGIYDLYITSNTSMYAKSYSMEGCISTDSLRIFAEVNPTPNPVVSAIGATERCENSADFFQLRLNPTFDHFTWFHGLDTMSVTNYYYNPIAVPANAGDYSADATNDFTHTVYGPTVTNSCSAHSNTVTLTVYEHPSVILSTFDGVATTSSVVADTFCMTNVNHEATFAISGGLAPYTVTWSNNDAAQVTHSVVDSIATSTFATVPTCATVTYGDRIVSGSDAHGCSMNLGAVVSIEYTLADTDVPHIYMNGTTATTTVAGHDCKYVLPNILVLVDSVGDGCGSISSVVQVPAVGTEIDSTEAPYTMWIYATDDCGHRDSVSVIVTIPTLPLAVTNIEVTATVLCAGDANGAIRVTVAEGTAPYIVTIKSKEVADSTYTQMGTATQNVFDFAGLIKGKWDIKVVDANGCEVNVLDTADVASPNILSLTTSGWTNLTCFESNNGSFSFRVKEGTAPYSVTIVRTLVAVSDTVVMTLNPSVLDTTVNMTNQKAGSYVITVIDAHNCTTNANGTLTQPDQLSLAGAIVLNNVKCYGEANGNAAITGITGGTLPYSYTWKMNDSVVSRDSVTGRILTAGTYTVTITDANLCTADTFYSVTIEQPALPLAVTSLTAPTASNCPHLGTYVYDAKVEGGRTPYKFEWTSNSVSVRTEVADTVADSYTYTESTVSCDTTFYVVFKVTDDSACVATSNVTYRIFDTVAPTLAGALGDTTVYDCPDTVTMPGLVPAAYTTVAALQAAGLTLSDNCTAVDELVVNMSQSFAGMCPTVVVRKYSVTDKCGLTSDTLTHIIYVSDTVKPVFTLPSDTLVCVEAGTCTAITDTATLGSIIVTDNCTAVADITVTYSDVTIPVDSRVDYTLPEVSRTSTHVKDTIYRTWKAEDACGNVAAEQTQTIVVVDTIAPVLNTTLLSDTVVVACDDYFLSYKYNAFLSSYTSTDNCAIDTLYHTRLDSVPGCNASVYTETWAFFTYDIYGNVASDTAWFQVIDTVAPYIVTRPVYTEVEVDTADVAAEYAAWLAQVTFDDACSVAVIDTIMTDTIRGCGRTAKYVTTWVFEDGCGNTAFYLDTFYLVDHISPIIDTLTRPIDQVVECDGAGNKTQFLNWLYGVRAYDGQNRDTVTMSYYYFETSSSAIYYPFDTAYVIPSKPDYYKGYQSTTDCEGSYFILWEAKDACGNTETTRENFKIVDHAAPVVDVTPTDQEFPCGDEAAISAAMTLWQNSLVAHDVCKNSYSVVVDTIATTHPCSTVSSARTYTVRWTVSDTCGNSVIKTANFRIYDSVVPHIITAVGTDTLQNDSIKLDAATCQPSVSLPAEGSYTMSQLKADPKYGHITGWDDCSMDDNSRVWILHDGTLPSDDCHDYYRLSYTFLDYCGNDTTLYQTVVVYDEDAPTFANDMTDTIYQGAYSECVLPAVTPFASVTEMNAHHSNPTIADCHLSNTTVSLVHSDTTGTTCPYVVTRYYKLNDGCDNLDTIKHTITILDTTSPVVSPIALYDTIYMNSTCGILTADTNAIYTSIIAKTYVGLTINDCSDVTVSVFTPGSLSSLSCDRTLTRTYRATDASGNHTDFTHTLTVLDTIAPTVNVSDLKGDTVYLNATCGYTVPNVHFSTVRALNDWEGADVVTDCNVGESSVVTMYDSIVDALACSFGIHYKYTVADSCGNMSDTIRLTITVLDTLAPVVTVDTATVYDTLYYTIACEIPGVPFWTTPQDAIDHGVVMNDCNADWSNPANIRRLSLADTTRDNCTSFVVVRYQVKDKCSDHWSDTIFQRVVVLDTVAPVVSTTVKDSVIDMDESSSNCLGVAIPYFTTVGQVKAYDSAFSVVDCNVGDNTPVTLVSDDTAAVSCSRTVVRTYSIADSCGLVSNYFTHTIYINDVTAPAITTVMTPQQVYMDGSCNFAYTVYTHVTDLPSTMLAGITDCNLKDTLTCTIDTLEIGGADCSKAKTVYLTYTVYDSCAHTSTFNDTVYVADTIAPLVVGTLDTVTLYLDNICGYTIDPSLTYASVDELPTRITVTDCKLKKDLTVSAIDTVSGFCPMMIHRTYSVKDSCGHTSTFNQFFFVTDTLKPYVADNILNDTTIYVDEFGVYTANAPYTTATQLNANGASVTDCKLVDAIHSVTADTTIDKIACSSFITRKYTVVDSCGNVSDTITHKIVIKDTIAPTVINFDYLDTVPAVRNLSCQFFVPDFSDTVADHFSDNWVSAYKLYTQAPVAGTEIINDTEVEIIFTDSCNNVDTIHIVVTVEDSIKISSLTAVDLTCYQSGDGSITVFVTGGQSPFTYDNGSTPVPSVFSTYTFTSLDADFYTVTVVDTFGCSVSDTITVGEPDELILTNTVTLDGTCTAGLIALDLSATGGTTDYTFVSKLWMLPDSISQILDSTASSILDTVAVEVGDYRVITTVTDAHNCSATDTSAVKSVYPSYSFSDVDRVCFSVASVSGYYWQITPDRSKTIPASEFTVSDSIYHFSENIPTSHGCDSIYNLYLNVEDNPFLKVRRFSERSDWSKVQEQTIMDTFNTASTNVGWEIFIDRNCTGCDPNIGVSIEYELYRYNDVTENYELMSNVTDYFEPYYRTFFDNFSLPNTVSNNSYVSIPDLYTPHGAGHDWDYDYLNLCWAAPDYNEAQLPPGHEHTGSGDFYADARANTILINRFGSPLYDGEGDYKIVATLHKRNHLNPSGNYTWNLALNVPVGGNSSVIEKEYNSIDIYFHVDASATPSPMPSTDPINGTVVFADDAEIVPQATVYPNPAKEFVQVELQGFEGETKVMLSSPNGAVLQTINLDVLDTQSTPIVKISTADYAQGVYLITARSKDALVTKRVVIIK